MAVGVAIAGALVLLLATSIIGTIGFALGFALMMVLDVVLG